MRIPTALTALSAGVLILAGCGSPGSSDPGATEPAPAETTASADPSASDAAVQECVAVPGEALVVLEDDQGLQTVDNIIPAVNAEAVADGDTVLAVLDGVSAALDTPTLIGLNKAVDVERRTSSEVAAEFLAAEGLDQAGEGDGRTLVVGAGNFSESATLAEIYAGALRAAGYDATTQTIGNRETYLPALQDGTLAVVPEYVGTLTEFLNKTVNGADAEPVASSDLDATVSALEGLAEESGLVVGTPSEAQDQNAFAVTTGFAEEYELTTLTDLAETCSDVVLGGPPECPDRPFCQPGLEELYGVTVAEFVSLDAGGPLTKSALQQGRITVGLVFSSDAALADS